MSPAHVLLGVGAGAVFGAVFGAAVGCEVCGGAGAAIGAAAGFVVGMPAGAIAGSGVRTAAGTLDSCAGAPCELGGPLRRPRLLRGRLLRRPRGALRRQLHPYPVGSFPIFDEFLQNFARFRLYRHRSLQ